MKGWSAGEGGVPRASGTRVYSPRARARIARLVTIARRAGSLLAAGSGRDHSVGMRVAVVGGGVGGLTAAIALARKGVGVEVFEQATEITAVGASLQLGPNALRLMDALGLLPALRRIGVRPEAVDLLRWDDGSVLLHVEHGAAAEQHFRAPQLDFFRPDLHRVLVASLPPGALRLGARVVGVDEAGEEVVVVLESGARVRFDAVIAADGIRSLLREQLVGADEPVFSGTVVYRGIAPYERVADLHPDYVNRYWLGPARHGISYRISSGSLLAVNLGVQDAAWAQESWTLEAEAAEAVATLEGWDDSLLERLRRCDMVLRGAVYSRRPIDHWTFGRVTLLGDAAHAMEPFQAQGAAQAVEDAYVLAACVAADADLPSALTRYETIRMSRAADLQASSRGVGGEFYLPDGPEQAERDAALARLTETQPFGTRQRIWEYDVRDALAAAAVAGEGTATS
jgi:2-polyprenyl-6-methoxyphenol hydroxylase-like FAD-dependent oxidoreductase